MKKKILAVALMICLIGVSLVSVSANEVDDLKQKQQQLEEKNKEYESILKKTKDDINKQEEYIDALANKIDIVNKEVSLSLENINAIDSEIEQKRNEIKQANLDIEDRMKTLRQRVKTIYTTGDVSSLEIILGAKDFNDFIDKLQLVKTLSSFDKKLINEIKSELVKISAKKEELEANKTQLVAEKEILSQKQLEYQSLLAENQEALELLYTKSDEAQSAIDENHSAIEGMGTEIEEYYAEQKRIAQKKAAEEQAKKDAEQSIPNSGSSSGGNGSGGSAGPSNPSAGGYVWPCPSCHYLTSEWNEDRGSYNHGAIDIGCSMWSDVVAAASGTVITAYSGCPHNYGKTYSCGCGGGWGNYIFIDHGNGKSTVYAHLSSLSVSVGDTVYPGQLVGYSGSTGESTGSHLHFETRYYGVRYNPMTEY